MAAKGEVEEMPSRTNSWSRDLLRTFGGETPAEADGGGDVGDVELSLGLSLGGRFGAEPKDKRLGLGLGLVRSSSIASFSMFPIEQRAEAGHLMRTCSLPAETEEERRRRKEMQSLKRMEAKRKRSEKRAAAAAKEAKERKDETLVEELGGVKLNGGVVVGPAAPPKWAAGNGRGPASGLPGSQASIGSQGSSSSSLSDFENKGIQGNDFSGPGNPAEVGSPSAKSSLSDQTNQKAPTNPPMSPPPRPATTSRDEDEPSGKRICNTIARPNGTKETTTERNMAEEMPCVSTRFDGPNGRRVEGFLYKYKKGEDVRIVCVCHGSFLSPAEFVKHAGGGDVTNPLKHIVVSQTSAAFF